jgi:hypothetical protein
LDKRWSEYMFISERNVHLTNWFCRIEFGSTQNSNKLPEYVQDLLGHQFHIDILVSITKLQKHIKIQSTLTYNKV